MQKIQVNIGSGEGSWYTYQIARSVQVGETVEVPPPYWSPHGSWQPATVMVLGSDYSGDLLTAR